MSNGVAVWFWWVGVTVKRGTQGVAVGLTWPPVRRFGLIDPPVEYVLRLPDGDEMRVSREAFIQAASGTSDG